MIYCDAIVFLKWQLRAPSSVPTLKQY